MRRAKIFKNGKSQAVRLPKDFRFTTKEVLVKKVGHAVVLISEDNLWDNFRASLNKFSSDFMDERRQPTMQRRNFFK